MQVQKRMQIYIIEVQKISFLGVTSRGIMDEKLSRDCQGRSFTQAVINRKKASFAEKIYTKSNEICWPKLLVGW